MIHNIPNILKETKYFIEYDCMGECDAIIRIGWKNERFVIKWDGNNIITNWNDLGIVSIPNYAASCVAHWILKNICDHYEYPLELVQLKLRGNTTNIFRFVVPLSDDETSKNNDLTFICKDITTGLLPAHIDTAKEMSFWEGLRKVVELDYSIDIGNGH